MSSLSVIKIIKLVLLIIMMIQTYNIASIFFGNKEKYAFMAKSAVDEAIGKSKSYYFSRENLTAMASKYGLMYMLGDYNLEASTFLSLKIILALVFAVVAVAISPTMTYKIIAGIGVGILGFFALDELLIVSNKSDNEEMQDDIISIYKALKIHAKSGVYISDSFIECQRMVSNKRLKEALTELNNNILLRKTTIKEAVDQFNARFENEQIDNLSTIIKQSLETGHAQEILDDVTKQIEDINRIKSQNEREKTKRKTAVIETIFFIIISGIVVFLAASELTSSLQYI